MGTIAEFKTAVTTCGGTPELTAQIVKVEGLLPDISALNLTLATMEAADYNEMEANFTAAAMPPEGLAELSKIKNLLIG